MDGYRNDNQNNADSGWLRESITRDERYVDGPEKHEEKRKTHGHDEDSRCNGSRLVTHRFHMAGRPFHVMKEE